MSKFLSDSFYVDDFIEGAANMQEGEEVYSVSRRIMMEGGFNLRKWRTNMCTLQKKMNNETDDLVSHNIKVLGLEWNIDSDEFYFELSDVLKYLGNIPPTKRSVLKLSSRFLIHLGFQALLLFS